MKIQFQYVLLCASVFLLSSCFSPSSNEEVVFEVHQSSGTVLTGSYSESASTHIAYINSLSGSVLVNGETALKDTALGIGSKLETLTGGSLEIIFRDHSIMRLDENSSIEIRMGGTSETRVELKNGSLWARVLKPFTDSTFFTLETDDISAGVRGTSVLLRVRAESTELIVIDSTGSLASSGAAVEYLFRNALLGSGALKNEEKIIIKKGSGGTEKSKLDMSSFIENDAFARENTIKDLKYMKELRDKLQTSLTSTGITERLIAEIVITLPTRDELLSFFRDQELRAYVSTLLEEGVTLEKFIKEIDRQEQIDILSKRDDITEEDKNKAKEALYQDIRKKVEVIAPKVEASKPKVQTVQAPAPKPATTRTPTVSGERRSVSGETR